MHRLLILLCVTGASAETRADKLLEPAETSPGAFPSISHRFQAKLDLFSNKLGGELSGATLGLVNLEFDVFKRKARFHVGGGDPQSLRFAVDTKLDLGHGHARVQTRLDLSLMGHQLELELPEFRIDSRVIGAERAVELSVPLLQTDF